MQSIGGEMVLWSQSTNVLIILYQAHCRHDMNVLLGIKKDVDIVYKTLPSAEEVEAFEAETGDGPVLDPMCLFFDVPASHIWNNDLAEQFVERFMHQHKVDESEEGLIHELFTTCYTCLKRQYNKW